MRFPVVITVFVFAIFSFAMMLHVKTDVGRLYKERNALLTKQEYLRESMKVQQAELAHLTDPYRLEMLADMAGMVSIETSQIVATPVLYNGGAW